VSRPWRTAGLAALALVGVALVAASVAFGRESLSLARAWAEWQSGRPLHETPVLSILINQRVPRTLAALFAGAGLAVTGAAFQALLRNPLATPYTLGVASSSALGAWLAYIVLDQARLADALAGLPLPQVLAFAFAAGNVLLVYLVGARRARSSPAVLLLAGVTLGMLANSGILLTRYLARPDRLVMMDRWLMGGVDVLGFRPVLVLGLGVTACAAVLLRQAHRLDQYAFSEELAAGRGVQVPRLQVTVFLAGSLLTAIVVSEVGPIGFVGLIVPHAVRALTGPGHLPLMLASLGAGAAFLCACDLVARQILPGETPIGIITTLVGAPFFLYLLTRRRFTDWEN
jgi:iron complex transport system permease protein